MIVVFTGLPGAGKSLKLAQTVIDVLYRNKKYYDKMLAAYEAGSSPVPPRIRPLYTNLQMSEEILEEFRGMIFPWTQLKELVRR